MGLIKFLFDLIGAVIGLVVGLIGGIIGLVVGLGGLVVGLVIGGLVLLCLALPVLLLVWIF